MEVKDIEGFEDYQISDDGRVWSKKRNKWMKFKNVKGYYYIGLNKHSQKTYFKIHRLVAMAFIQNPDNKPCVGHKDCNPLNNKVENLYWCTYIENNNNPITKQRQKDAASVNYKKRKRDQNGRFSS